ncbi:PEP-CTERM sorting domain-containing protein [Roseateles oligotrophus]|uniref:PEP-CTERM sorting domain-containing protein n=1 Tax=Roseateles oligotrophus TaxID=1769250 RepID=A0ABT2YKH0_9BURK|nr:PEP-CTERM sorting domain-containing protein [Roseateles oligotrophus]MCV2370551.1 PEP-CTERM sorting domain-containing protein [Roseateles oligotrophus]
MNKIQSTSKYRLASLAVAVLTLVASQAQAQVAKPYFEFKKPKAVLSSLDVSVGDITPASQVFNASGAYVMGFEGISQYDLTALGKNAIPPDTIGAVGANQYMTTTNGVYGVYDKFTGVRTSRVTDTAFWAAAGQVGASGDSRVMYNSTANRWIAMSFGANVKDLQIAVSDTSDALGSWKSTKFEGYAGMGFGGTADYPTLALDRNAVYIGTNNFAPATAGGANSFRGTTLNVIPLNSLFSAAPSTENMTRFFTPYDGAPGAINADRGFAIQGVNSNKAGSSGKVLATSLFNADTMTYKVNGLLPNSATAASLSASVGIGEKGFESPSDAHQPSVAIAANRNIVAAGDERTSSSIYEANGRIYMVKTVDPTVNGVADESRIRYTVLDANTNAILDQGDIGQAGYDYYQGSIAVNDAGQVVIGYNRSGLDALTGKISFMGQSFSTGVDGHLISKSGELLLKESLTDDYHNGSVFGQASVGRQRWGDYSSVSVDPTDSSKFYLIGEFAREYNNDAGGHPGGSGGSRWGTWVAVIDANVAAVPEPSTWLMLVCGMSAVGFVANRRRRNEGSAS